MQNISSSSKISFPSPYVFLLFFLRLFLLFKYFLLQIFSSISFSIFSLLHKKNSFLHSKIYFSSAWVSLHCKRCTLFSIFFCTTEQAQTYLKIWVLVSQWTYICRSLLKCAENTFFLHFCDFQTLDTWFPLKYAPVSTPSSLNVPLYSPLLLIVSNTGS